MATFNDGLPLPDRHTFRFVFGAREGLTGVYPVSDNEIFYFHAFPAPRACPSLQYSGLGCGVGVAWLKSVCCSMLTLVWRYITCVLH